MFPEARRCLRFGPAVAAQPASDVPQSAGFVDEEHCQPTPLVVVQGGCLAVDDETFATW
jgi:hypothetical protein